MDVGGETNSESNVLLSSEDTDESMSDLNDADAGNPDVEVGAIAFPAEAFLQVMEGLNKLPTWTVYPKQLTDCIRATSAILRSKQGFTREEGGMIRRLVREGLGQAFPKCLDDNAVMAWPTQTQHHIFGACLALIELATQKLEMLIKSEAEDDILELEEDLQSILSELGLAFDPTVHFHLKNIGEDRPSKFPSIPEDFASATHETDSMAAWSGRAGSPEPVRLQQHEWLAYFVNEFGRLNGFQLMCQVLQRPQRHSILFLDSLLAPLVKAEESLLPTVLTQLSDDLQGLLAFLSAALSEDLELLSDKGRDRMFTSASSILEKVNALLTQSFGQAAADASVGETQRQFIVKLLGQSSFSKHLSAVRETNNLLMRSLSLRNVDNGNSVKVNVDWMRENNVVKHLLRANLHQKQYVDQVQKVLKNLTIEGGLQEDHLDLLWNLTEKVDTFEAVKNNVYDMLGDLAQDFNNQQLDALFSKFEACTGRPDSMKIMDLMRRLAKSDTKGVMAKRVMSLLWSIMMDPEAPSEVSKSPAITDALQAYANRKGLVDKEITYEYMRQCVMQIKAGSSVLAAMSLLQRLINAGGRDAAWPEGIEALQALEKDFGLINVVITSLEGFMRRERQALEAAGLSMPCSDQPEHLETVKEYASFLLNVPISGNIEICWGQIERMWQVLIAAPIYVSDRTLGFHLLHWHVQRMSVSDETLHNLLTQKLTAVDVSALRSPEPQYFWLLFSTAFQLVAVTENKLHIPQMTPDDQHAHPAQARSLDMTGLPTLWRVVLDSDEGSGIVDHAQQNLVSLHTSLVEELEKERKTVRMQFIDTCLRELRAAAQLLTGREPSQGSWRDVKSPAMPLLSQKQKMASRRAARCLALLQDLVATCQGRTMPAVPMHVASFQGSITRFDVQTSAPKQQPNRVRLACHSHTYIGQMRRMVAAKMGCQPENLRLFAQGRELLSDARLIKDEHIMDGSTLMAAISPQANSYTLLTSERAAEIEEASPASLLAKAPQVYDVLLCLADLSQEQPVQLNALRLLDVIPTDSQILQELQSVLASASPQAGMQQLLAGASAKHARLLYILQALTAMLFPVGASEDAPTIETPQVIFVNSGCITAVLGAIKTANSSGRNDNDTVRSLHSTAQLLLTRLQPLIASKAGGSDISMPDASALDAPTAMQDTASDGGAPSADFRPASPTASVTVTLEEGTPPKSPSAVNRAVLSEMVLFYLNLAIKAGRGWGGSPLTDLDAVKSKDMALHDQDAAISQEAMLALKQLLDLQPQLLDGMLTKPEHTQALATMMLEGLLNFGHEGVRSNAFRFGERLCLASNGQGHLHLLGILKDLGPADCHPQNCREYYRLVTEIIKSQELPIAEAMLRDLIAESATMTAADEEDGRLEGKLNLLLELITVLDRRHVGAPSSGNLVHLIITDYLFPESWFLHQLEESKQSILSVPLSGVSKALKARCCTKSSRAAALALLHDLMTNHSGNLRDGMELIRQIHLSTDIIPEERVDYAPRLQARNPSTFVGLRNAGATCYMNSVFQQLFMQPSIRRLILSAQEVPKPERIDSVFYQLQSIFANLALSNKDSYRPASFWKAFKDYDGEPLNVREHQDAYEFFTRLQDLVDQYMRDNREKPAMQLVMGGKFAQQIICRSVSFRSEKEEDFYQVSLDVRGKRTLEESLDFYVQGELMEGDNQYLCEELNQKVDAVKRNCIKALPHMLVIHLKRFEYDYETMNRWKIKDRFEFPQELDMYKYTVRGLEEREASEGVMTNEEGAPSTSAPLDQEQYKYHLKGIVVHSGTAFAGHYYSYIKVRSEAGSQGSNAGGWFCFDDNTVEPWDVKNLDSDCFGGKYTVDLQDPHLPPGPKEYDRPNSAYMLFYERDDALEPVLMMDEMKAAAPQEAASLATGVPVAEVAAQNAEVEEAQKEISSEADQKSGAQTPEESSSGSRDLSTVPLPDVASSIPSIYEDVLSGNLKFMQEVRLLDRDYFKFLLKVVQDTSEEPFLPPSSMRRTEPSPTASGGTSGSHTPSPEPITAAAASGRREADTDQAAERVMNFAGQFLLRVYLRSAAGLREDQEAWSLVISSVMEANAAANRWFLNLCYMNSRRLSAQTSPEGIQLDEDMLENYLIWCQLEDVSKLVASLVFQALKNAIQKDNGLISRQKLLGKIPLEPSSSAFAVHQTVLMMQRTLKRGDFLKQNYSPMAFIHLLRDYAAMGPEQREHMHGLNFLKWLLSAMENADDRSKVAEIIQLLGFICLLARSTDFNLALEGQPTERNPYALDDPNLARGSKEVLATMCGGTCYEYLFWPQCIVYNESAQLLLEFLLWQNHALTMDWLRSVPKLIRRLNADTLVMFSQTFVRLIAIRDSWKIERVKLILYDGQFSSLLAMACDMHSSPNLPMGKRFAIIRLIIMLVQTAPQVYTDLQGVQHWMFMSDWLEKMQAQGTAVCSHPDFEYVDKLLQRLITGGVASTAVNQASSESSEDEDAEEPSSQPQSSPE